MTVPALLGTRPGKREERPRSIRFRLLTLVALILLPLLLVLAGMAVELAATQRTLIEQHRSDVTRRLSARADREAAVYIGMLKALASSPNLAPDNVNEFERHARALLNEPEIVRVWAFSRQGVFAAVEGRDGDGKAKASDESLQGRVLAGETVISNMTGVGGIDARFVMGSPVLVEAQPLYGVAIELRASFLSRIVFSDVGLPDGWVAAIVDRANRFVARSLDGERRVGDQARPQLGVAANSTDPEGTFENVTHEGSHMLNSYFRSPRTSWTAVVAVPVEALTAPMRKNLLLVTIGGAIILVLTAALASIYARQISEPVQSLSRFALALKDGKALAETRHRILELEEVRAALETTIATSAHLSALVATSGDAIMSVAPNGTIMSWNAAAEQLFGYKPEEIVGKSKKMIVPGNRTGEFDNERSEVLAGGATRMETVRRRRDGSLVEVSINSSPILSPDGKVIAISSIIHDISERKAAEAHIQLLMRELAHRSKNQIAVIQSIAGQTARTAKTPADFLERFGSRLRGLSTSYDLLTSKEWNAVDLAELVDRQLEIFAGERSEQLVAEGPRGIVLNAAYAEALGLALHELATNAVKYGAWSTTSGKVAIAWSLDAADADAEHRRRLRIAWTETGGPAVSPPQRKGFGSTIVERMVARSVHGTATMDYATEGVRWTLVCPLPELAA